MGAHNAATLEVARERAEKVRDILKEQSDNDDGDQASWTWFNTIDTALERGTTTGTLRGWMTEHDGMPIDTLQATIRVVTEDGTRGDIVIEKLWAPGSRRVDATRAATVLLNDSRRDYAGVTTFLTSDSVYVGFASYGKDRVQMLVYAA